MIGSIGTTFYIILKGSVEIWVNIPKQVDEIMVDGKKVPKIDMVLTNVKVLNSGESFGELALMDNRPRAATIKCKENCHLAVLEKNHFNKILSICFFKKKKKKKKFKRLRNRRNFYLRLSFFSNMSYLKGGHLVL